jgi:HEAT repeat protein
MTNSGFRTLRTVLVAALAVALLAGDAAAASPAKWRSRKATKREEPKPEPPGPLPAIDKASWIWGAADEAVCQVRTAFTLPAKPTAASILITADNSYELFVNGAAVGSDEGAGAEVWSSLERYDLQPRLTQGKNTIGIRATDLGGIRGLVAAVRIEVPGRAPLEIVTDGSWRVAAKGNPVDYSHPEFVEGADWAAPTIIGPMGMAPWGPLKYVPGQRRAAAGLFESPVELSEPDETFRWPEGLVFVGDDCSVYTPLRGDAWGVCFRVNGWSRAYTEFDIPCPAKIGRKLYALAPVRPDAAPRLLVDAGKGAIGSPSVSFDGRSIYVSMALGDERFFHIYRVPAEGGPPQRLTDGPFHDLDPAELPDGRIVFSSTRIGSFEEYHNPPSRALYTMRPDGSQIEPITFTLIFDNEPKVMADGRIAFIRSDNFFDRAKVETQIHVIRPDGADGLTELGADVGADYGVRLRALGYGSPAPMPDGRLACISTQGNFLCTPGNAQAVHRLPDGLGDLAALPDGRLLATVLRPGEKRMESDVIAVIDPRDNRVTPIYECLEGSVHSPVFLGSRPRPPVLAETVDRRRSGEPGATGFLTCHNIRFTRKTKAGWEHVRAVRVLGALALTTRSSHSHIVHAGHETVELGTVPLAPDGSFSVEVPADMPIALQAVDAEGRSELNEMSWIYVRPGERRSCLGCHHQRHATPRLDGEMSHALRARPLKLVGQGDPHRFRGNNAGVTGMMDLQFERFRETASLNRHTGIAGPLATGRQELAQEIERLGGDDVSLRISAANRLALLRERTAAPALAARLRDSSREVRTAAAMALAACGTRQSVPPLVDALSEDDPVVAQAAAVALENLTGHAQAFQPFAPAAQRKAQAGAWRAWFEAHSWEAIEQALLVRLSDPDRAVKRRAIVALGHVGGERARAALRQFVAAEKDHHPYPAFVNDNRTDSFTFPADSPLNPRTLQEAVRALGYLGDTAAVPLLREVLAGNIEPKSGNLYLAEAAIEALGRIATPEAEAALVDTFGRLKEYYQYVGWYSDHPALYACHASPLHARILEALDAMGSTRTAPIASALIRSVPTDPDRALFPENDDYETLVGRVLRRSGRGDEVIETCLSLLGDPQAAAADDLKRAISTTFPAWAGTPAPDNRAAQVLSAVCRDARYEPRVRAAYERYRARPEDRIERPLGNPSWIPQRHWVLFYLGRSLGNLGSRESVGTLVSSLGPELNEARHGRPDPSEPNVHFLHLEYTPCWRASAAWALGRIGDRQAAPALLSVLGNLDNALDVRHAAAEALGRLADPASLDAMRRLARQYPEHSVRRALLAGCGEGSGPSATAQAQ